MARLGLLIPHAVLLTFFHGLQCVVAQQVLAGHSLGAPPDINQLAADWFLGGAVIPSLRSLVLLPGTPNRQGLLWNQFPLLTNDFEVSLKLQVSGAEKRTVKEDGFAFWYVNENASAATHNATMEYMQKQEAIVANTWEVGMASQGFDLFGYRSKFDGLGVVFSNNDAGEPVVSTVTNDGKQTLKLGAGIPATNAIKYDRTKVVHVKIRVQPTTTKVELVGVDLGQASIKMDAKSGGYMGMSIFGGKKGVPEKDEKADKVEILEFQVTNLDSKQEGEKMPQPASKAAASAVTKPEDKSDVLADSSSFKDHRAESDAIKELTNMVFKLTMETQPMRQQLQNAIGSLEKRITAMEGTFENLKQEIDKKTGHHLGKEFDAIKKELTSLSTVASKETQERHKRLETLHEDIADVHKTASSSDNIDHHLNKLTESNQRTLNSLTNEHQKMFGVSIAAIGFVIIAGLSLYNKFRCWEKKHVL